MRRAGILYFVFGAAILGVGVPLAGAEAGLGFSTGLWLQFSLLILVSAFLLETRFTSGGTAVTNAVAVLLMGLGADPSALEQWWWALIVLAASSLAVNLLSYGTRAHAKASSAKVLEARRVAVRLGSWKALLVPGLALSAATFNTPFGREWALATIVAGYTFLVFGVRPHEVFQAFSRRPTETGAVTVSAIFPPTGILIGAEGAWQLQPGQVVGLGSDWGDADALILQPTVTSGGAGWWLACPDLRTLLPRDGSSDGLREVVIRDSASSPGGPLALEAAELSGGGTSCAGLRAEGSTVQTLKLDLIPDTPLAIGDVVWTLVDGQRCYWQLADATVERVAWGGDARRSIRATASQIGLWREDIYRFDSVALTPAPDELVFRGPVAGVSDTADFGKHIRVGSLVGTGFPILIDPVRLGRHHSAILGTTGTGKTHLAFALVEALANSKSKVICVDLTGQYQRRFPTAKALANPGDVVDFINDIDSQVGVLSPGNANPIEVMNKVARSALSACKLLGPLAPNAIARCVIVVDEAHNFVPETFVISNWDLKAMAQDTSMVLMESRKFGLGFSLVSQRTAMVTKSALSQCNTVFAFQAVDQTGLDYLEGLCGRALARTLPVLPHRTAIMMGQAVMSGAPLVGVVADGQEIH